MKNIFYFKHICAIGGTEQFLYEIAKAYNDFDITIYYKKADPFQLKRLSQYVRCRKYIPGRKIYCDRAFLNFNIDIIDDIESSENYYAFVAHANFAELGYKPPIQHLKLNHFFGVSPFACEKLELYAKMLGMDIKCDLLFNPLSLEPKEKVMHLLSACRLEDEVKGGKRTKKLVQALDEYCEITGRHYRWDIYTNSVKSEIESKNVAIMKPRVDVRPYIADADIVLQLSNDMETYCYTLNEAWGYGVHTISTPLTVLNDLPVPKEANFILKYDCSNINDVVRHIFEDDLKPFKYEIPQSSWDKVLKKGKADYKEEVNEIYKVRAKKKFIDIETGAHRQPEEEWEVTYYRLQELLNNENDLIEQI